MLKKNLYIYGDQNVQVPIHLNFGKYMLDHLRCMGDETAIKNCDTDEKITYKELTYYTVQVAELLYKLGVRKNDVVGLGYDAHVMFVPMALGIILCGATYTAFDTKSGKTHLENMILISEPKYIIATELFSKTNEETLLKTNMTGKLIKFGDIMSFAVKVDIDLFEPVPVVGQVDTAIISYTSGTTSVPKAVQSTHLNCILYCSPSGPSFEEESLKTVYVPNDFSSTYIIFFVYQMLALRKTIVFSNTYYLNTQTLENMLMAIQKEQVNMAVLVPSYINTLLKTEFERFYKLKSLHYIFSAGFKIPTKSIEELKKRYKKQILIYNKIDLETHVVKISPKIFPYIRHVLQGYGMTETHFISTERSDDKGSKIGSVGLVSPGIILKVINPETQEILGPNQQGLICVKGPALMKGYVKLDPSTYLDEEEWFRTGDLGYYDRDQFIFIVGRFKQIISYHGSVVSPFEIESILLAHPGVRDAAVVGKPEPTCDEEPTAFVVRQANSNVTEQELIDYVQDEMPGFIELKGGVKFIDELPRNRRKKILYENLLEMLT